MSPALTFREELSGHVAFGNHVYADGARLGREDGTRLVLSLMVVVADVDAFLAAPDRTALVRGTLRFDELGISLPIQRGEMRVLPGADPGAPGRVHYIAGVRTERGEWVTVRGRKTLDPSDGRRKWRQLTTVETRILAGRPDPSTSEDAPGQDEETIATGELRLSVSRVASGLGSFRARARSRVAGGVAVARFWAGVAGAAADVYAPRPFAPPAEAGPPEPDHDVAAAARRARRREPQVLEDDRWRDGKLLVHDHPLEDDRGSLTMVQHLTVPAAGEPTKGPVLLAAGSSVAASIFAPFGVEETIIHRLASEGYDVWLENWRGSLGHAPREYSLDEAAVLDHPRAVEYVAEQTESKSVKAVVHCLGSSGFMLALASGRLHERVDVPRVVSNSVSLHPVVPLGSERKLRAAAPVVNRLVPYLDPRWAGHQAREPDVEPLTDAPVPPKPVDGTGAPDPSIVGETIVRWVQRRRRGPEGPVTAFAQWMYGSAPSALFDPMTLEPATLAWLETQFAWAPLRLYRQIGRSLVAGHLVPMREWAPHDLPPDLFRRGPADVDTKITFMTGTANRCFSPLSQQRTYEWFSTYHGHDRHALKALPGFGHLDVWLRPDAAPVFDVVVEGLAD
jgi:hypothetical protein